MVKPYKPSPDVVAAHNILHLDPVTQQPIEDPQFMGGGNTSELMPYVFSLIGIPVVLLVLGVLAILMHFIITKLCRCLCGLFCKTNTVAPTLSADGVEKLRKKKNLFKYICFGTIFVIFITDCFIWLGNGSLSKSFDDLSDSAVKMGQIFQGPLNAVMTTIEGTTLLGIAMSQKCTNPFFSNELNDINTQISAISNAGNSIQSISNNIDSAVGNLQSQIESAKPAKDMIAGIVFAVFLLLCILNITSVFFKNKCFSCIIDILNYKIILLLVILCTFLMVLVMFFGDFCMDPIGSITAFLPGSASKTMRYFAECKGSSPMGDNSDAIDGALGEITDLQSEIRRLEGSGSHTCSEGMNDSIQLIQKGIDDLKDALSCKPVQETYDMLINQAMCTSGFSGLYQLWGDLYFMALFFFIFMCFMAHWYGLPEEPVGISPDAQQAGVEMVDQKEKGEAQESHAAPHHFG